MSTKKLIWIFVSVGSLTGGYLPILWGGSLLSYSSILLSGLGGAIGVFIGYKIGNSLNT